MIISVLYPSRDHAKALELLASSILEKQITVSRSNSSGGIVDFVFLDSHNTKIPDSIDVRNEANWITGVQTFIGTGENPEFSDTPGLMRHPVYPIWWSTYDVKVPKIAIYEQLDSLSLVEGLSKNPFIARTQLLIILIDQKFSPEIIRDTGYKYLPNNSETKEPVKLGEFLVPDPEYINLIETHSYEEAIELRGDLTRFKIQSCIHPSNSKPVVAYISAEVVDLGSSWVSRKESLRRISEKLNYTNTDFSLLSDDEMGIIHGRYIPINE